MVVIERQFDADADLYQGFDPGWPKMVNGIGAPYLVAVSGAAVHGVCLGIAWVRVFPWVQVLTEVSFRHHTTSWQGCEPLWKIKHLDNRMTLDLTSWRPNPWNPARQITAVSLLRNTPYLVRVFIHPKSAGIELAKPCGR